MILETERLILREWREDDLLDFARLRGDPQVMEHFQGTDSLVKVREYFPRILEASEKYGYWFRPVVLRETGAFIGFCGIAEVLIETSFVPATEIGWSFLPAFWGKGHATEAAKRWLRFAFEEAGKTEIVAFAVERNYPSHAVMRRLGMRRDPQKDFDHPNVSDAFPHLRRHIVYSITKADWRQNSAIQ